jgi:hypothetical protein
VIAGQLLQVDRDDPDWLARVSGDAHRGLHQMRRNLLTRARDLAGAVTGDRLRALRTQLRDAVTTALHHRDPATAGAVIEELEDLARALHAPVRSPLPDRVDAAAPLVEGRLDPRGVYGPSARVIDTMR